MAGIGQIGIGLWRGRRAFYALLAILGTSLLADYDPSVASRRAETYLDGAGEQVVNGSFDTDTVWTKGTGITITGGVAVFTGVLAAAYLEQAVLTVGATYAITFTVTASANTCTPFAGTQAGVAVGAGTYTQIIIANGTALKFGGHASGFTGTIDNVSVVELPACDVANAPGLVGPPLIGASHATALKFNPTGGPDGKGCLVALGGQYGTCNALAAYYTGSDKPVTCIMVCHPTPGFTQAFYTLGNSAALNPYERFLELTSKYRGARRDDAAGLAGNNTVASITDAEQVLAHRHTGTAEYVYRNTDTLMSGAASNVGDTTLDVCAVGAFTGSPGVSLQFTGTYSRVVFCTDPTEVMVLSANASLMAGYGIV